MKVLIDEIELNKRIEKGERFDDIEESNVLSEYRELPNKADEIWELREQYASTLY